MKTLNFRYRMQIRLDAPVSAHHFSLRCMPVSDARQRVDRLHRRVSPCDFLSEAEDAWGNALLYGACRNPHTAFEVCAEGTVRTGLAEAVPEAHPERWLAFLYPTPLTEADAALRDFAAELKLPGADAAEQAVRVTEAVYAALEYRPGSTNVQTTAAQAFAAGQGVCQDYAHVMLAVLRAQGIPARYAVGMLSGEGESHAWVEVLCRNSWYAFDPTNRQAVTDRHIKLSHGRDYRDCTINRGVFRGIAAQQTQVSVRVTEAEAGTSEN